MLGLSLKRDVALTAIARAQELNTEALNLPLRVTRGLARRIEARIPVRRSARNGLRAHFSRRSFGSGPS